VTNRKRYIAAALVLSGLGAASVLHTVGVARGDWVRTLRDHLQPPASSESPGGLPDSEPQWVVTEGRVAVYPGDEVAVSPEVAGRVVRVLVGEGQVVRAGELLAEIAADDLRASLSEARWKAAETDADIHLLEWKVKRAADLVETSAASALELEERQRELEAARARRNALDAAASRIDAQLAKTQIHAPIDGTVIARSVHPGQAADPAVPCFTIANLARKRIEAEVNEFDGGRVATGALAAVTAEGYPGKRWRARVEEIPYVVTNRQMRPQDPGRPTDTGIVLVKLELLDPAPLRLGQRVEIRIYGGRTIPLR
jgi:RND family efflux transporter MFP subunit